MRSRGPWRVLSLLLLVLCAWEEALGWSAAATRVAAFGSIAAMPGTRSNRQRRPTTHPPAGVRKRTALWLRTEVLDMSAVDPNEPTPLVDAILESLPEDPRPPRDYVALASDAINAVITMLAEQRRRNLPFDESVLVDNAEDLTKNELYESIMSTRMSQANATELEILRHVDAFMQGFVVTERAKRLDLKIKMLIMFALGGELQPTIEQLREMQELDRPLLVRIRQKIQQLQEIKRQQQLQENGNATATDTQPTLAPGPAAPSDSPSSLVDDVLCNRDAMAILKTLENRIEVELRLADRWELHLVGSLLRSSHEEMVAALTSRLRKIEQVQAFEEFLDGAIETVREQQQVLGRRTPYAEPVKLAPETYERLKALKAAFDDFKRAKQSRYLYDSTWPHAGAGELQQKRAVPEQSPFRPPS